MGKKKLFHNIIDTHKIFYILKYYQI